jgi:hypothetical protein
MTLRMSKPIVDFKYIKLYNNSGTKECLSQASSLADKSIGTNTYRVRY